MNTKLKAETIVKKHLIIASNLLYEYGINESISELKNDENIENAKKHAIVTVNEVLEDTPMYLGNINPKRVYWEDVKREIENI